MTLHPFQGVVKREQGCCRATCNKTNGLPQQGCSTAPEGCQLAPLERRDMSEANSHQPPPLSDRIRRSSGRHARRISATAKVTSDEHAELEAAATKCGKALGEWSRETLLAAARGEALTPSFTEIIAIRQLLNSTLRAVACGDVMTPEAFQKELQGIRSTKHKAAAEVMQQYATTETAR